MFGVLRVCLYACAVQTLGSKGRPFGLSIYKELYWDEAEQKVYEVVVRVVCMVCMVLSVCVCDKCSGDVFFFLYCSVGAVWFSYACEGPFGTVVFVVVVVVSVVALSSGCSECGCCSCHSQVLSFC